MITQPQRRATQRATCCTGAAVCGMWMEYADNVAVIDTSWRQVSTRTCRIGLATAAQGDLEVAPEKYQVLWVQPPGAVSSTTEVDIVALRLQFQCACGWTFPSSQGLGVHSRTCGWADIELETDTEGVPIEHKVDYLLEVRGPAERRYWRVKWAGVDSDGRDLWPDNGTGDGTVKHHWQREEELRGDEETEALIASFWRAHRELDRHKPATLEPDGQYRCEWCNRIFRRKQDLNIHLAGTKRTKPCSKMPKIRQIKGTAADRLVQRQKQAALLETMDQVRVYDADGEVTLLQNRLTVDYLGHLFQSDGDCMPDIDRRCAMARQRFNALKHIWQDKSLSVRLKLRLYARGVLSVITYRCEAWVLSPEVQRKLMTVVPLPGSEETSRCEVHFDIRHEGWIFCCWTTP